MRGRVVGGLKWRAYVANAKRQARSGREAEVGLWGKYVDGTSVAEVAQKNEFGDPEQRIPERPFFRRALKIAEPMLKSYARKTLSGRRWVFDQRSAQEAGLLLKYEIQKSITDLREPPNAPSTIRMKKSSNPLIDTGTMRRSVKVEVHTASGQVWEG